MKQTKLRATTASDFTPSQRFAKHLTEGGFILVLAVALFIFFSLFSYQIGDSKDAINNAGGQVGEFISNIFYKGFGYFAYVVPLFIVYLAGALLVEHRMFRENHRSTMILRGVGLLLFIIGGCGLLGIEISANPAMGIICSGGIIGQVLVTYLTPALNIQGALLLLSAVLMVGLSWVTGLSWIVVMEWIGRAALQLGRISIQVTQRVSELLKNNLHKIADIHSTKKSEIPIKMDVPTLTPKISMEMLKITKPKPVPAVMPSTAMPALNTIIPPTAPVDVTPKIAKPKPFKSLRQDTDNSLPSLDLLTPGDPSQLTSCYLNNELETLSRDVEQHLLDFGIQVDVVAVHPGPVITRFELQLAAGIKVSRLSALSKDLARSLSVTSVRIVEIIPGKTVVGIELPNPQRKMVCLSDVLSADVYQQAHSPLTLALGVDIAGHPMVVDLAKMPHLLVAGTTGSGKSVGINAMILSLLFKATPEQVRLIMVDPKMLELSIYDGIPHLLTPVVTDMKEAASALRWCVAEMERRYRLMASLGVRNLAGYNTMVKDAQARGETLADPLWKPTDSVDLEAPALQMLPYVVVVIDELADMMMVVGKKVEQLIARIAQKARAAGIHLILATQRPSVDVLTGLIKSNIPTRISFQVSSKIDSRTILDQQGAEQLLGHGDMLFLAPGTGAPLRVHGAFVDDQEVHRIADDCRSRGAPDYIEDITQTAGEEGEFGEEKSATEDADPIYDEAVAFVMQTRKASISSVQRRFKIGYNRAARLVEEMERCGLVGPLEGGFRDVLVDAGMRDD